MCCFYWLSVEGHAVMKDSFLHNPCADGSTVLKNIGSCHLLQQSSLNGRMGGVKQLQLSGKLLAIFCDAYYSAVVLGSSMCWPDWRDGMLILILSSFAQFFFFCLQHVCNCLGHINIFLFICVFFLSDLFIHLEQYLCIVLTSLLLYISLSILSELASYVQNWIVTSFWNK